ncbi:hypothetical protein, partial [Bradyrhizobium sp. URHD0069]|uniref:hypothetical protein n=1 Tax=Bradyrhizobium sp. URHD0069 TaxID=1380355 RepID=UPI001AEBCB19
KTNSSPGRARYKPLKPLRAGMPGVPVTCGDYRVLTTIAHGLRVHRAPGIPHALTFPGRKIPARLGRIAPRDRERASEIVLAV